MDSLRRSWPVILFLLFPSCIIRDLELAQESNINNPLREISLGKVIYGVDNRYDVFDYPKKGFRHLLALQLLRYQNSFKKRGESFP